MVAGDDTGAITCWPSIDLDGLHHSEDLDGVASGRNSPIKKDVDSLDLAARAVSALMSQVQDDLFFRQLRR